MHCDILVMCYCVDLLFLMGEILRYVDRKSLFGF